MTRARFFTILFALLLASRLCHLAILWEGDAYPLAAAEAMRHGRTLYRDLWFDKPPLLAALYLPLTAGWPLRVAGALFALLVCWLAYRLARDLWSEREGRWAAALLAFFLIFDLPSAAIPVASDLMMVAPHLAAVWLAYRRRPFWSGALAGVAFWISPKALFVLAACALWYPAGVVWTAAGFLVAGAIGSAALASAGALSAYWDEVWRWGRIYARAPFLEAPLRNGLVRTANWAGFHAAIVVAAALAIRREPKLRWTGWLAVAAVGVVIGLRFFPRYYFLLLPPVALLAARGVAQAGRACACLLLLLAIPLVRFGPSYIAAVDDPQWRDTAMDRDSRAAAALIKTLARPGDSLFVWGYRPELYVYTNLRPATMYLDSQPLSGVPADRHLTRSEPVETEEAGRRRAALVQTHPTFIADGLGLYNPALAIGNYPELRAWLAEYREVARTAGTVIYARHD